MASRPPRPRGLARVFREPANALTHLFGVVLAAVGTVALVVAGSAIPGGVVSALVFGASMMLLYTASTLLHGVSRGDRSCCGGCACSTTPRSSC
jgi:hemolysin III